MNPPTTVAPGPHLAQVLAGLPLTLAPAIASPAALSGVTGDAGWVSRVRDAAAAGARGVVVCGPGPADPVEVHALATLDARIVVDGRWAANPVVPDARAAIGASPGGLVRATARIRTGEDAGAAAVDLIHLLGALGLPIAGVDVVDAARGATTWTARTASGARVAGLVVASDAEAPHATIRLDDGQRSVELLVADPDSARPATVRIEDAHGARELPTRYEDAHRAAWRRAAAAIRSDDRPDDLDRFADALIAAAPFYAAD